MHTCFLLILLAALTQAPREVPATPPTRPAPQPSSTTAQQPATLFRVEALQQQVMLDRAGFSPGIIDGRGGPNTAKAFAAFQQHGSKTIAPAEAVSRYLITEEDAAGPYVSVPTDMMEKASLPALGYGSLLEALAERFHASPALLQQMNPGIQFLAGQEIQVPNVEPMLVPVPQPPRDPTVPPAATRPAPAAEAAQPPAPSKPEVVVTVSKAASTLTVTAVDGAMLFHAPVTTGSEHDPLPLGEWKVNGVQRNPTFHYNPSLFWDADPAHAKAKIPAGPNNPVGVVWIDISKDHYGLHGTPEPSTIGRTESHGCVRLTNWDALRLAGLVKPGTRVVFSE